MPVPAYGAAPLSKTFALVRVLEVISMIIIVGIAANFVNDIVSSGIEPPKEVVGTLSVVSPTSCAAQPLRHTDCARPASPLFTVLSALLSSGPRPTLVSWS